MLVRLYGVVLSAFDDHYHNFVYYNHNDNYPMIGMIFGNLVA